MFQCVRKAIINLQVVTTVPEEKSRNKQGSDLAPFRHLFSCLCISQMVTGTSVMPPKMQYRFSFVHPFIYQVFIKLNKQGLLCDSAGKESAYNVGDLGSVPGLERSRGEGKGYPLQYSGLENSMDCIAHGVAKCRTWLNNFYFLFLSIKLKIWLYI